MKTPADLNRLEVFVAVARRGGFTAAADVTGLTKARVSQEIARLEALIGATLFNRTTRRVNLTEAGHALLARCEPALRELGEGLAAVQQQHSAAGGPALQGLLRISATVDHAVQSLAGIVNDFARLHPALEIELRTSDRVLDLVAEGIDVSIRMGWLRDSSLRAARLGEFEQWVVAAPRYLRDHGTPRSPAELAGHDWVALTLMATPLTWRFTGPRGASRTVRMTSRLRCDSAAALRALLVAGAGVSVLDAFSCREAVASGRLVRLLPAWELPRGGIHAVYAPGRHVPAKVRAFIDHYAASLAAVSSG